MRAKSGKELRAKGEESTLDGCSHARSFNQARDGEGLRAEGEESGVAARVRTSAKPLRATALRAKSKVQRTKTKEVRARRFALSPLLLARADRLLRKRDLG